MANNVAVTAGSGTTMATDDVGGVHYQLVKLVDGTEDGAGRIGGDATNGLDVDVTRVIPGTSATHLGKAEDAAHTTGDTGVMVLGVRQDAAAALAGTDGDYIPPSFDSQGFQRVKLPDKALSAANFTRPGDTTTYAVGDAVNDSTSAPTVMTFSSVARVNGGAGYIVGARAMKSTTTTTNALFRLHVYHTTVTAINDNTAQTVLYANRTKRVGAVDLQFYTDGSDCAEAQDFNIRLPFVCDSGDAALYGVLQAKGAYVPGNAETFFFELTVERD